MGFQSHTHCWNHNVQHLAISGHPWWIVHHCRMHDQITIYMWIGAELIAVLATTISFQHWANSNRNVRITRVTKLIISCKSVEASEPLRITQFILKKLTPQCVYAEEVFHEFIVQGV